MGEKQILPIGVGYDEELEADRIIREAKEEIRQESKLEDLTKGINPHFRYHFNGDSKQVVILGAAGETETANVSNLKTMSDPIKPEARKDMIECAYTDPILSPSFERIKDAQFEDGYTLEFELASSRNEVTDEELTPEEQKTQLSVFKQQFLTHLNTIRTWEKTMNLEEILEEFTVHEKNQGRCVVFYFPGIFELQELRSEFSTPMPNTLEIVPVEDLKEPIVDVTAGKKLVGVNTNWKLSEDSDKKRIIRKDEMVYGVRRNYMLRKDSNFYGSSTLEPILIMSKALKRLYNFDIPDAIIASYITKIIFQFQNPQLTESSIRSFITSFLKSGKKAFGINQQVTPIPVKNEANINTIQTLEKILTDAVGAVLGVPKSMLNREEGLNRSIAEAELIQFIKYVRKPDERHVAKMFEDQLLNPLFAYLCGKPLREIPLRIRIKAKKDPDDIIQELLEEKGQKLEQGDLKEVGTSPSHVFSQ